MTERQPYEVIGRYPGFELRHYPQYVVAEVAVRGRFEAAGNRGFMPLAGYIGGRNADGASIAMTAPVLQERAAGDSGEHLVSFVLPAERAEREPPAPSDPRVRLRTVPEQKAAAVRFRGRWTRRRYQERADRLLSAVTAAGMRPAGEPRFARYDPPWTPWFARRNEVVVPVVAPGQVLSDR